MTDLKLVTLGFALCAWCEFAQAQVQSRTETIESARTEKEANLKPESPPKAERDIEWIEHSLPYRLVTSQADGFGVVLGSIVPARVLGRIPRTAEPVYGAEGSALTCPYHARPLEWRWSESTA